MGGPQIAPWVARKSPRANRRARKSPQIAANRKSQIPAHIPANPQIRPQIPQPANPAARKSRSPQISHVGGPQIPANPARKSRANPAGGPQIPHGLVQHEKALTLQARILKHTLEWLVFVEDPAVEPTNNRADRALRPLVVLRKITFGSRSDVGASRMATIMTVGQTAGRRGHRASRIFFELYTRPPDSVLRNLYGSGVSSSR